MSAEFILILVALGVSVLLFMGLIKIVKTAVSTAFAIALILLAVLLLTGIGPVELWQQVQGWLQEFLQN